MVSGLENIKELEKELIKVRLEITEKEQEREKVQKSAEGINYVTGVLLFFTICAWIGNTFAGIALSVITGLLFFFVSLPKANKISRLIQEINAKKKKKKKQLEKKLEHLNYLAKVKAKKEKEQG